MVRLYQVDAFTSVRFKGNPAGVCLLDADIPDGLMRSIAMEMNLSETAFVKPTGDVYFLRWFTPTHEVPLCGHATLATAHVLFKHESVAADTVTFETLGGRLVARRSGEAITLDFPIGEPRPAETPTIIVDSLGLARSDIVDCQFCTLRNKYLVRLKDQGAVLTVNPDFQKMRSYESEKTVGVIITAEGADCDFVSRFFAPWVGVDEDPVTGSAHTVLGPYWAAILGKDEMWARQVSKRGGELTVRVSGGRVLLTGQAVTVFWTEIDV